MCMLQLLPKSSLTCECVQWQAEVLCSGDKNDSQLWKLRESVTTSTVACWLTSTPPWQLQNWKNTKLGKLAESIFQSCFCGGHECCDPPLWLGHKNGLSLPCDSPPLVLRLWGCALSHHQINSSSPESSQHYCGTVIPIRYVIAFTYISFFPPE